MSEDVISIPRTGPEEANRPMADTTTWSVSNKRRIFPRTKIVGTLGPSSNTPDTIRELIQSGLDVARINFSHGTH